MATIVTTSFDNRGGGVILFQTIFVDFKNSNGDTNPVA